MSNRKRSSRFGFRDSALSRGLTTLLQAPTIARNAVQQSESRIARTSQDLEEILRAGNVDEATGVAVTPDSAMRVAAVFACVALLSRSQGMLPMALYSRDREGKETVAGRHAVHQLIAVQPNPWQTPFEFETMMTAHKMLRGDAFAHIQRKPNGVPIFLTPLNPARMVKIEQLPDLTLQYHYERDEGRTTIFKQSEIHHRRGLSVDGVRGLSPISAARRAIGLALRTESYGSTIFKNAAAPSGVLRHPKEMSAEAILRLREQFSERYSGSDNAGRPLVLEEGMEWSRLSMTAEDTQFIESRKFQRSEIAMFYGIPPHMIGDVERGTSWGSGIEQQSLGFLVYTLMPYLLSDEQALARDLLSDEERTRFVVKHDTAILTRAQFLTRQQGLQIQLANGVINPNEWRKIEGLNPRSDPGGEEYQDPSQVAQPADATSDTAADPAAEPLAA